MNPTTAASMTPQGQATNSLQQALSQISGMAQNAQQDPSTAVSNYATSAENAQLPTNVQNVTQQLTQQSGIPQLQGAQQNLGQIFGMYLADQNLASKYASPQLTSGTPPIWNSGLQDNPQQMAGLGNPNNPYSSIKDPYLSSPAAIVQAIMGNQAYSGAQTPGQNDAAIMAVPQSAANISSSIGDLISSQQELVDKGVQNYQTQYGNIMDSLNNLLYQTASTAFNQAQPGSAKSVQNSVSNLVSDIKKKMTLKELMAKYQQDPNLTADKILQLYNSNSPWGPANEDPLTLQQTYGVTGGFGKTSTYQQKTLYKGTPYETVVNYDSKTGKMTDPNTGKPVKYTDATTRSVESALQNIDSIWNQWNKLDEVQKHLPDALITAIPALSPTRSALNTQFYTGLEGDLRKAIVGGRITQQEIQWIKNAIVPTATDSDASAKAKLNAVEDALRSKLSDPSIDLTKTKLPGGSSGKNSDPLGIL